MKEEMVKKLVEVRTTIKIAINELVDKIGPMYSTILKEKRNFTEQEEIEVSKMENKEYQLSLTCINIDRAIKELTRA